MRLRHLTGRTFEVMEARGGQPIAGLLLDDCTFDDCFLESKNPAKRMAVRSVTLRSCRAINHCSVSGVVLDDVVIDGLETRRDARTWATAFRHVTLKGKIGKVGISGYFPLYETSRKAEERIQRAFDEANREFHGAVDWALDISEAEFMEFEIRSGIPANRVRRDPETQFVIKRERAAEGEWKRIVEEPSAIAVGLEEIAESSDDAGIIVACKRSRRFKRELAVLQQLRKAGIAEPL